MRDLKRLVSLIIGASSALTGAESGTFYYVNGAKVSLSISDRYFAVKLKQPSDVFNASVNALAPRLAQVMQGIGVFQSTASDLEAVRANRKHVEKNLPVFRQGDVEVIAPPEVIVRFRPEVPDSEARHILGEWGDAFSSTATVPGRYILTVGARRSAIDVANKLAENVRKIRYAEPNFVVIQPASTMRVGVSPVFPASPIPSPDPLFTLQWSLHNSIGSVGADIRLQGAWEVTFGSESVSIAILDDGVDSEHPDLKPKIVGAYSAIDGMAHADPKPWNGHGTACAGIAAAMTRNAVGISGIAANAKIMPIQVATQEKKNGPWTAQPSALADGIRKAVEQGADVISYSWRMSASSDVEDAIDFALSTGRHGKGVVFVFAAGNEGSGVSYPARLSASKSVIAVSATNEWDELKTGTSRDGESWWASNTGPEITVAAPGVHILTTDIHGEGGFVADDYVANFNGTSSAVPSVAGVAALVISRFPQLSASEVRDRITSSADDLGQPGKDDKFGYGRINACRAVGGSMCGGDHGN